MSSIQNGGHYFKHFSIYSVALQYVLELSEIYNFADFCHYDVNWTHLHKKNHLTMFSEITESNYTDMRGVVL